MSKELVPTDFVVIGAGIVGLFIARALHNKFPQAEIVVLEQAPYLGEHTSGRNSGVLHAGIYYPNQSQKHLLCLRGNEMWDDIAGELNIPFSRCGKWIVAKDQTEDPEIEAIMSKATANQVPDMRWASSQEITELNHLVYASRALFSPRTGIVDQSSAVNLLKDWLQSRGVTILLSKQALNIQKSADTFTIECEHFKVQTPVTLNCAGLSSITLRRQLNLLDLQDYWVKGYYVKTSQAAISKSLIYPVPPKNLKGLGVHLTLDMASAMKFGPNTVDVDQVDYSLDSAQLPPMIQAVQNLFKTVDASKLYLDYTGIRPKIKNKNNELVTDFKIQNPIQGYWEFLGIESPGFTAAPAIAEYFIQQI